MKTARLYKKMDMVFSVTNALKAVFLVKIAAPWSGPLSATKPPGTVKPAAKEIIRWFLIGGEIGRGRRFMSSDVYGEGKENKSNPAVSSKSKDGDENGNGRSSRDDAEKNARQNNMLVGDTLIATVTFAAGLTMPGGYISEKGLDQGVTILTRNTAFKVFVLLNSMSMFLSSLAVFTHLLGWHNLEEHNIWSTKIRLCRFLIVFAMLADWGISFRDMCGVI